MVFCEVMNELHLVHHVLAVHGPDHSRDLRGLVQGLFFLAVDLGLSFLSVEIAIVFRGKLLMNDN